MKRLVVALVAIFAAAGAAGAHAKLARTEPKASSTVARSPAEVKLWFTENLEASFSGAHVLDGRGQRISKDASRIDPSDPALLRLSLPALAPGAYTVVYRVVSVDSHVTSGEFMFRVAR